MNREENFSLNLMCFDKKLFLLNTIIRPLQGCVHWILYVQMAGNIKETSMFGVNIVVFRYGDSTGGREILSEVFWRYLFC